VLEVQTEEQVRQLGTATPSWYVSKRGLFADEPHLCLIDCAWDDATRVSAERFTVFVAGSDHPDTYVCTTQAYADAEYEELLKSAGFASVRRWGAPDDVPADADNGLVIITAEAPAP
jgi:hypothetical protein